MSIELSHLEVSYEEEAVLRDFSFSLPEKGFLCLIGPSGCGKSTLLGVLAGLVRPQSGRMEGLEKKKISMVFQEDRLLPWCSALENVSLPGGTEAGAKELLGAMGLGGELDKKPEELSGGMRRRVSIARALQYGGDVFLLDEPLKGLDPSLKETVLDEIHTHTQGALTLMVTHDWDEALSVADRVFSFSGLPFTLEEEETFSIGYNERKNNLEFYENHKRKGM